MTARLAQLESYMDSFTEFARETASHTPAWLSELREAAFIRFCNVGFPTLHDEDWRFTSISAIAQAPFQLARRRFEPLTVSDLAQWRMKEAAARMVFWNGHFAPALSTWGNLPEGITVNGLSREIQYQPDLIADSLGHYLEIERDPFHALNTAFAEDGAYVHVSQGVVLKQPIHLLFISAPDRSIPIMTHPRNLIMVDEAGEVTIVEDYVSFQAEVPAFSNAATELVAGTNAAVTHTVIEHEDLQAYNISTLRIEQARNANVASHSLLLGGALVRNNVHPVLAGEGGECLINGLYIGGGRQHLDNYMLVEHKSAYCSSRQFYNGILDDHSHGVFHGRIVVHKGAQKTDAKQTNRNLLLSDNAQINSKPQLEIYADDVKCTHGATTGQIEKNALFYLRSRGLSEADACWLLLKAFASECLDRMKPGPDRDYAEEVIVERLHAFGHAGPDNCKAEIKDYAREM